MNCGGNFQAGLPPMKHIMNPNNYKFLFTKSHPLQSGWLFYLTQTEFFLPLQKNSP
jgi:hypothetical protein